MRYTCSNTVYLMENQKVKNVTAVSDLSKPAFVISMVRECATVLANIMRYLHCFMTTLLPSRNAFHLLDSDQLHYWGNKKSNSPGICCPMHGIYFCKMSPESTSGAHLYSAYRLAWCCGLSKRCVTCGFSCLLETQISIITNLKQIPIMCKWNKGKLVKLLSPALNNLSSATGHLSSCTRPTCE